MVWDEIAAEENLDGLSEEQKATFRERAVPVPGGVLRGQYEFTNDARRDIPSTVIATGYTAADYKKYASEHPVPSFLAGIPELRNVTWIDLPTSHWPMWSKPAETAKIIGDVATAAAGEHPMTASLLDDSMAHHIWATQRLLDFCDVLTPEQLRTPAPGTYGPILATFTHMVSSDGWYLTFFRDWTNAIDEENTDVTLAELRAAITATGQAWMEILAANPDGETDTVEHGDGWDFHAPVGFRLAQVVHHGTDHRSQICTALTSLGHRAARDRPLGLRRGDRADHGGPVDGVTPTHLGGRP